MLLQICLAHKPDLVLTATGDDNGDKVELRDNVQKIRYTWGTSTVLRVLLDWLKSHQRVV